MAETLAACDPNPAVGLEASVVTQSAAMIPHAPWPFLVHVTNHPDDSKVVYGVDCDGDPDLALHDAVLRQRGWTAVGTPLAACVCVSGPAGLRIHAMVRGMPGWRYSVTTG